MTDISVKDFVMSLLKSARTRSIVMTAIYRYVEDGHVKMTMSTNGGPEETARVLASLRGEPDTDAAARELHGQLIQGTCAVCVAAGFPQDTGRPFDQLSKGSQKQHTDVVQAVLAAAVTNGGGARIVDPNAPKPV